MKRHGSKVLAVMLALALMESTANAQAVTPSAQEQNRQLELQRAARLEVARAQLQAAEAQLQAAQAQQRGVGPGQRGGGTGGLGVGNAPLDLEVRRRVVAHNDVLNLGQGGGAWWTNTALVARLGLTDEQKGRIEKAFEANRQNIVSSTAALEKEEAELARLLSADPIVRSAVMPQVDCVIQARGNMERTNAAMTLEMREQLTRAQWMQLQSEPTWFGQRVSRQELSIAPPGVRGTAPSPAPAPAPAGPGARGGRGHQ